MASSTASIPAAPLEARVIRADPDRRVIPARQLEALWRRGDIALRDKAFWRLAYDSAARAGELFGLDLADLDLDAKTGSGRSTPEIGNRRA